MVANLANLMTPKQREVWHSYLNDDWKYLINSGAVRAGKTYIDNIIFLAEIRRVKEMATKRYDKQPKYILAGFSSNSIYDNVISELYTTFGLNIPIDRHGHYHLFGVEIIPAYTGTKRGIGTIRGMTSYGAYVNEASLSTQEVFQEIIQRCSIEGARIIADTNPDNPEHWLKKDYIDKAGKETGIDAFHFTLDDNTWLSRDYIDHLKAITPSGMYYDRSILGLWVSGEGAVYRDFDERKMVKQADEIPMHFDKIVAGVDWGYEHACSITVWGLSGEDWWLLEEHTEQYREIDYWTDVAHQIQKKYGQNIPFYADSARPEHCDHFKHAGINCQYGWKSVVPGIEEVAKLMKTGHFFVSKDAPVDFMNEIYNYRWDDKAEDKPIKEADHVMDSMRYALASYIHMQDQKKYYPKPDRKSILAGMRRFGL